MELILGAVALIAVVGQIITGVFMIILNKRERESLYKLIKSKDIVEYVATVEDKDEEEEEVIKEVDVDQIPDLYDSRE